MRYTKSTSEILSSLVTSLQPTKKLALHFSGSVNQSLLLKTILCETTNNIVVYCAKNSANSGENNADNLRILRSFQSAYRHFEIKEISLEFSDVNDVFCHAELMTKIYKELSSFDVYLFSQDARFFADNLPSARLYHQVAKHNLEVQFLAPLAQATMAEISAESFCGILLGGDINFSVLYRDHKKAIDSLKALDPNESNYSEITDLLINKSDANAVFRYLISASDYATVLKFVRNFGELVNKNLYIHNILSGVFKLAPQHEELIILALSHSKISTSEFEEILQILLNRILQNHPDNNFGVNEIDYFFRLFDYQISQLARDNLAWQVLQQEQSSFREDLLDKLIQWRSDSGDLFLRAIEDEALSQKSLKLLFLLQKYRHKMSAIQLNEALFRAFENQLFQLCHLLIEAGADVKILKFNKESYAELLWSKSRSPQMLINRNDKWRERDRVIIKEILQELGNPQQKIPPIIHVTGSNGKGSVCAFMHSILRENGYKVHVFATPSALRGNEDIVVSGAEISDQKYYEYLQKVEEVYHRIKDRQDFKDKISAANKLDNIADDAEFGWLWYAIKIPVAMLAFAESQADVTIVEVITGGEFCLTNIFEANQTVATVINEIIFGDNHAGGKIYGDFSSIQSVAKTKSRLAKNRVPIICAPQEDAVMQEINRTAQERDCPLLLLGRDFTVSQLGDNYFSYHAFGKNFKLRKPKMIGEFQINNAAIALTAIIASRRFNLKSRYISRGVERCQRVAMSSDPIILNNQGDAILIGWGKNDSPALKAGKYVQNRYAKSHALALMFCSESGENIAAIAAAFAKVDYDQRYRVEMMAEKHSDNESFARIAGKIDLKFVGKNYLSSTINHAIQDNKSGKPLLIHINSRIMLALVALKIFAKIEQPNFHDDLNFAYQNKLISEVQYNLMNKEVAAQVAKKFTIFGKTIF